MIQYIFVVLTYISEFIIYFYVTWKYVTITTKSNHLSPFLASSIQLRVSSPYSHTLINICADHSL